jgi:hypothetical protein
VLIAAMGEPLDDSERTTFTQLTGRQQEPLQRVEEFVGVIGRRGGKSRAISVLATYIAALCDHPALVRGERGIVLVIAPDVRQARIILDYIEANFTASRREETCGSFRGRSLLTVQLCCAADCLFDHLVGDGQQRLRDSEAERSSGLQIEDELKLGGISDRQVSGLSTFEDIADQADSDV